MSGRTTAYVIVRIDGISGAAISTNGTTIQLITTSTLAIPRFELVPQPDFDGTIEFVFLAPVQSGDTSLLQDGSFDVGVATTPWTFEGDASLDDANNWAEKGAGGTGHVTQDTPGVILGREYKMNFTLTSGGSGVANTVAAIADTSVVETYSAGANTLTVVTGQGVYPLANSNFNDNNAGFLLGDDNVILDDVSITEKVPGSGNFLSAFNGDFSLGDDGKWTKGAGWTIAAGVATCDGTDATRLYQDRGIQADAEILVKFEITARTAGSVQAGAGGALGNAYSAVGIHMDVIKATATGGTFDGAVSFLSSSFNGSIDNVEVYQVEAIAPTEFRVFDRVHYSYAGSGAISGGFLAIVGRGGVLHLEYVTAKEPGELKLKTPFVGTKGNPLVAILVAPGANVTGRLNALIR